MWTTPLPRWTSSRPRACASRWTTLAPATHRWLTSARLPLDQLKIDQSFVHNLGVKQTDDVIVQTIIGMARNLELDVIAEGVETAEQRDTLARYGCHYFQGYLLGRPMPLSEMEALLGNDLALLG